MQEEVSKIQNQINLVQDKITQIYRDYKTAHEYAETSDRINQIKVDVSFRLRNVKKMHRNDKNGINRIKYEKASKCGGF